MCRLLLSMLAMLSFAASTHAQAFRSIAVDVNDVKGPLNRAYRFSVGSDRAIIHLRSEHQRDLKFVKETCGFEYMRFHGLLNEEMHIVSLSKDGQLTYDWKNVDAVYDLLVHDLKIRPIVELGFMPEPLASGKQTIFWWKGNVTPPKSYEQWGSFIEALARHLTERYGGDEVRKLYFEVWNEPNLDMFWTGKQDGYWKLYEASARAIKRVDPAYRVGGPSTAGFGWIKEQLDICQQHNVPIDFVSSHSYGTTEGFLDEQGKGKTTLAPGDNTVIDGIPGALDAIHASAFPKLPFLVTEWGPSYSPRDPVHDSYFAAAWILQRLRRLPAGVEAMSYWTFSDQFEESGLPDKPFHGGFGLLTWQGLPKPAYYAYRFLDQLGDTELKCADENVWATRDNAGGTQLIVWDYHQPELDAPDSIFFTRDLMAKPVGLTHLSIAGLSAKSHTVKVTRVGYRHNDIYDAYLDAGSPAGQPGKGYLMTDETLTKLRPACSGEPETRNIDVQQGQPLTLDLPMNENDVYSVIIDP